MIAAELSSSTFAESQAAQMGLKRDVAATLHRRRPRRGLHSKLSVEIQLLFVADYFSSRPPTPPTPPAPPPSPSPPSPRDVGP